MFIPVLTAPTAAGKSALALELAQQYPLEVVSADAFTVYRGLDIGTAKPSVQERAQVPHHLLDVVEVNENYDVARFVREAEQVIDAVLRRGNIPLIVGGTGFYLSALLHGLPLTPPADPARRAAVEAELHERGLEALLAEIAAVDPAEERRMERNPRRVVRAVELLRHTGKLPGHYGRTTPKYGYQITAFSLPNEELAARQGQRIATMFQQGWADEAAWLASRVSPEQQPQPTVWQALGYRDALTAYRQEISVPEAVARVGLATRQYAKRQLTFTRTQLHAAVSDAAQARNRLEQLLSAFPAS